MSDNLGSSYDPKKMAIRALSEESYEKQKLKLKKRLCWSCQKDKPVSGGSQKMWIGLHKFICKDCCEEKLQKKKNAA